MSWIQTYTGKIFDFTDDDSDVICIEDIAHSLAMQTRFAGHCKYFYSVAEHSVAVWRRAVVLGADATTQKAALLHDATEAYLTDIPRPLKLLCGLTQYRDLEAKVEQRIRRKFDIVSPNETIITQADNELLATEAKVLMGPPPKMWDKLPAPLKDVKIQGMTSRKAKKAFLAAAYRLGIW